MRFQDFGIRYPQTVIDLSRNADEWDPPGYSHASHHSKSSAYESNEEHHGDVTQRNTKRPCTTAAKDTLAQDLGQLADDIGKLKQFYENPVLSLVQEKTLTGCWTVLASHSLSLVQKKTPAGCWTVLASHPNHQHHVPQSISSTKAQPRCSDSSDEYVQESSGNRTDLLLM